MSNVEYFEQMSGKLKQIEELTEQVTQGVNTLTKEIKVLIDDIDSGKIRDLEQVSARLKMIGNYGIEVPPRDLKEEQKPTEEPSNPMIVCKIHSRKYLVPVETGIDWDHPIREKMREAKVSTTLQFIVWLIKHFIRVDIVVRRTENEFNEYKGCLITDVFSIPDTTPDNMEYAILFTNPTEKNEKFFLQYERHLKDGEMFIDTDYNKPPIIPYAVKVEEPDPFPIEEEMDKLSGKLANEVQQITEEEQ